MHDVACEVGPTDDRVGHQATWRLLLEQQEAVAQVRDWADDRKIRRRAEACLPQKGKRREILLASIAAIHLPDVPRRVIAVTVRAGAFRLHRKVDDQLPHLAAA